ncbi:hypothetical protein ACKLNR_014681 [Fusarium oxysporum f. sp. zingiberi]
MRSNPLLPTRRLESRPAGHHPLKRSDLHRLGFPHPLPWMQSRIHRSQATHSQQSKLSLTQSTPSRKLMDLALQSTTAARIRGGRSAILFGAIDTETQDPAEAQVFGSGNPGSVDATGQTCLGSVFNAAFGLIDNERREGFQFLSESIRQLAEQHSIRRPDVIITDFDEQMKAALNDQFPDVQQQLCIHHINSNVLLKSKQKWAMDRCDGSSSHDDSERDDSAPQRQAQLSPKDQQSIHATSSEVIPHSYQGVLMMWKFVLFAETEEAHEKACGNLCKEFDDQRAILRYLHGTYMPVRAQWARCFIRKYRNFGIRVTSGTEASNNNIKSYLLNGMSHLYRLVEAMQDMIKDQERDFSDACAADEVLTAREYMGSGSEYLGDLRAAISSKGLGLINKQYRLARKAMPTSGSGKADYQIKRESTRWHRLFRADVGTYSTKTVYNAIRTYHSWKGCIATCLRGMSPVPNNIALVSYTRLHSCHWQRDSRKPRLKHLRVAPHLQLYYLLVVYLRPKRRGKEATAWSAAQELR